MCRVHAAHPCFLEAWEFGGGVEEHPDCSRTPPAECVCKDQVTISAELRGRGASGWADTVVSKEAPDGDPGAPRPSQQHLGALCLVEPAGQCPE